MKKEVEVFGVTYDRYVLLQLHRILTRELNLKTVVEMPSHGAKAAGSLYSIGFGLAGCVVQHTSRTVLPPAHISCTDLSIRQCESSQQG